jgi:hypothetical protein
MKNFALLSRNFKNKKSYLVFAITLFFSFLSLVSTTKASDPYCVPYSGNGWSCYYMWISNVTFNTINNNSSCNEYSDYSQVISTDVKLGSTYELSITAESYAQIFNVWIDYNQNGEFEYDELVVEGLLGYYGAGTQKVTIPANATPGHTVMRILSEYYYWNYSASYDPCYIEAYGEAEDYGINIMSGNDVGISALTSPLSPFTVGNQTVITTLKNFGDNVLTSAWIDWKINGVAQTSFKWSGSLKSGETEDVNLGIFDFNYPASGPFSPFIVTITSRLPNGSDIDDDHTNDSKTTNVTPILNDCGAIGFFGPSQGFGAGVTPVKARVKNYAPKPLSKVTVNWKMDGILQTPVTISGLNVKNGDFIDLDVGTYLFYNKTPLGPFNVECWTTLPNGINDEDQTNDKYIGGIGPSLTAGTYKIGGSNAHFPTIVSAASYLNSGGVFGTGAVYFDVRPNTYTGQIILNNQLPNANSIIFRSESGRNSDVTIDAKPSAANNFIIQINSMNDVQFKDLSINNNNSNISFAGKVFDVSNVTKMTINNCLINGIANAPKDAAYSVIVLNNAGIEISKSMIYGGAISIDAQSTSSRFIKIQNSNLLDFSWMGTKILGNQYSGTINVENNSIRSQGVLKPNYGIWLEGPGSVNNNVFDNINGTGDVNEGIIKVVHSFPMINQMMSISHNVINNCSNINGLKIENAYVHIDGNYINISQTLTNMNALGYFANCMGVMGNNELVGKNIYGFHSHNMSNFEFLYIPLILPAVIIL